MFDPHRTRRSNRRVFTRKGQVNQASLVNTQPIIEQRLVPIYKEYLFKNNLAYPSPVPPSPPPPAPVASIIIHSIAVDGVQYPISSMTKYTTPTVNLSYSTGVRRSVVIIIFYKDTGGNHFCKVTQQTDGTFTETIENNAECYFLAAQQSGIVYPNIDTYEKGFLDQSGSNYVISFIGSQLYINNSIPLTVG